MAARFVGTASDPKPTIDILEGTEFFEYDTGDAYVFGGGAWRLRPSAGGSSGTTQYNRDTAAGAADALTMAGAVRKDTAGTLVGADGDRSPLQLDSSGLLRVGPGQITANGGTPVRKASSATAIELSPANTSRTRWAVDNNSSAILYLRFGAAPVITGGSEAYDVRVPAGSYYEDPQPVDVRQVQGIWAAANGFAMVSERTA